MLLCLSVGVIGIVTKTISSSRHFLAESISKSAYEKAKARD